MQRNTARAVTDTFSVPGTWKGRRRLAVADSYQTLVYDEFKRSQNSCNLNSCAIFYNI